MDGLALVYTAYSVFSDCVGDYFDLHCCSRSRKSTIHNSQQKHVCRDGQIRSNQQKVKIIDHNKALPMQIHEDFINNKTSCELYS